MEEAIRRVNDAVNGFVWGPVMLILLVGTGIFLTFGTGFVQFSKFGYAMKNTLGKIFKKTEAGKGEITPFQAVSTALAATVGTGNIVGVTTAIIMGGPGAVFWMWIAALAGMCTKYAEVLLAVKYRERNDKGDWVGGPMYYIKNGLGKKFKWLGGVFAVLGAIAAFGIGNIAQINSISGSVLSVFNAFKPELFAADLANAGDAVTAATNHTAWVIALVVGIVVALFVAIVVIGGVKRIGQVTEKLVPFMAVVYILCAIIVVVVHGGQIGHVFGMIFKGAFNPAAVTGGVVGAVLVAMQKGVARGVFSNEAGLGSAPIAHAATSEKEPVKQAVYGIFEVFMDTIVICTLTALVVMCSGAADGKWGNDNFAGASTTIAGFSTVFGDKLGSTFLALALLLFATSTILGWALYGSRCMEYLFGTKSLLPYQIAFTIVIVLGATMGLKLVWDVSDTLNGLMAFPNLIGLLLLSPVVIKTTKDYFKAIKK